MNKQFGQSIKVACFLFVPKLGPKEEPGDFRRKRARPGEERKFLFPLL
jgi:hypothetical protein